MSADQLPRPAMAAPSRRSFLRSGAVLGLSVPFASAWLTACGDSASGGGGALGSVLTVRARNDIANLDPAFWTSRPDANVSDTVLEGLVSFEPGTFDPVNTLAETFEKAPDGMSYTFKLKEGIQFHGGYGEVTAEDVKFSFERIAGLTKPRIEAVYADDWSALKEVEVTGTYSGVIRLKHAFTPLERTTLPSMSGKVLSRKAAEELGDEFATKIVGTGPYQLQSWTPDQKTVLTRFEEYGGANSDYAEPPVWESIEILPITEDSTAANALRTGEVLYGEVGITQVDTVEKAQGLSVESAPGTNYQFLSMNVEDPILSNIKVRQAIRLAVDVEDILTAAYHGHYVRANAPVAEAMGIGYWADAPQYDRDVEQAKQLMTEAGVGEISLRLTTLNAQAERTAAQVIQSNLAEIGITVELDIQDSATLYEIPGEGGGGKDRQLVYLHYTTEPDPHWVAVWWTKAQKGLWNFSNWSTPRFEQLYAAGARELDEEKRDQIYVELQQEWDESCSVVWVANWVNFFAAADGVETSLRPDAYPLYWDVRKA